MGDGKFLWGYHPATETWIPLQVDVDGKVIVDMSAISLGDLANVRVPAPADNNFLYWDATAGEWTYRPLVDADIPAAIARDAEVADAIADLTFLDLPDTPAAFAAQAGKVAKVNASETALDFGLRTKVTFEVIAANIFVESLMGDTPFTAKINGAPTDTSVVYDTDVGENSVNRSLGSGNLVLHNLTRGNSRLIIKVTRTTNTIATASSTDDWANNDDLTTQSQVNAQAGYVDIDFSGFVTASVTGIFILLFFKNTGAIGEVVRLHPYETYSPPKSIPLWNKTATLFDTLLVPLPIISQRITLLVTASGADTVYLVLKYFGKFEDT